MLQLPNEVSSARAALQLHQRGITLVRPLAGGLNAGREHNYPIELRDVPKAIKATVEAYL